MAFRANEIAEENRIQAERYLLSNLTNISKDERERSRQYLQNLINEMGPVVDGYPIWHPLIMDKSVWQYYTRPHKDTGYDKLDHTVFLVNGFITCPYNGTSNFGQDVLDAINAFPSIPGVLITAEKLPVTFYSKDTTPILVKCVWPDALNNDNTLRLKAIMPKLLSTAVEINKMGHASFTLDDMEIYLLGTPCGKRSSLFVDQATGLAIKKMWKSFLDSEML